MVQTRAKQQHEEHEELTMRRAMLRTIMTINTHPHFPSVLLTSCHLLGTLSSQKKWKKYLCKHLQRKALMALFKVLRRYEGSSINAHKDLYFVAALAAVNFWSKSTTCSPWRQHCMFLIERAATMIGCSNKQL
jgi:hypothetical protein